MCLTGVECKDESSVQNNNDSDKSDCKPDTKIEQQEDEFKPKLAMPNNQTPIFFVGPGNGRQM